ncbi:MAG: hypothetical protein LBH20_06620, partial [Treponema sp.]|nr:hypothetical protein [Treponema sp.]
RVYTFSYKNASSGKFRGFPCAAQTLLMPYIGRVLRYRTPCPVMVEYHVFADFVKFVFVFQEIFVRLARPENKAPF